MCKPTCSSLTKWLLTPFYSTLHPEKHWKSTNIGDDDYVCCFDEILKRMITKKKLTVQSAGPCSSCHRLRCCCGSVCRICQTKHKTNHVPHQSFSTRLHKHTTQIDREREKEKVPSSLTLLKHRGRHHDHRLRSCPCHYCLCPRREEGWARHCCKKAPTPHEHLTHTHIFS